MAVTTTEYKDFAKSQDVDSRVLIALNAAKADLQSFGIDINNDSNDMTVIQLTSLYLLDRTNDTRQAGNGSITYNDFYNQRNKLLRQVIPPTTQFII